MATRASDSVALKGDLSYLATVQCSRFWLLEYSLITGRSTWLTWRDRATSQNILAHRHGLYELSIQIWFKARFSNDFFFRKEQGPWKRPGWWDPLVAYLRLCHIMSSNAGFGAHTLWLTDIIHIQAFSWRFFTPSHRAIGQCAASWIAHYWNTLDPWVCFRN